MKTAVFIALGIVAIGLAIAWLSGAFASHGEENYEVKYAYYAYYSMSGAVVGNTTGWILEDADRPE
ncbi:MAG: hypothetical protein JZD41_07045 [Thermoproteus sp.]|nr:hypothetical protein [Thermoproteus sp.]